VIGKSISHFRILEKLGEGGMGQVFLAHDTDLDRRVALKFLPPSPGNISDSQVRLLKEARLAASLNHPNICTVHEIGETDEGGRFIAMENVPGESLEERLDRGHMEWPEARDQIRKIARGLAHAHTADIIHRDIKPSNIMITPEGEPKILDFGLARLTADPRLTRTGAVMGTMAYLSPEQLLGEDPDKQSDIWALGVVFYQMLKGELPFKGDLDAALVYSISHGEIPSLAAHNNLLPAGLQKVMDRLLDRDKAVRYASLDDFLSDLDAIEGGGRLSRPGFRVPRAAGWLIMALMGFLILWGGLKLARNGGAPSEAPEMSIAVLPLENLSANPDQEYFADGFTGELIAGLTRVRGLQVMARGSVMGFRNTDLTVDEIAEKLGVERVVTGAIQEVDNVLQVTVEIIDIDQGFAMWADSFQGSPNEVLQLQGSMTRSIVEVLKGDVSDSEEILFSGRAEVDPEAYRSYLKGKALTDTWGVEEIWQKALGYFREAARIEPGFAPAYAAQADMYYFLSWIHPEMEYPSMCKAAAQKALDLDPDLPEANSALATYLFVFEYRWDEAQVLFTKALESDPGNVDVLGSFAVYLRMSEQCDEAIRLARKAADLDPLNFGTSRNLANALLNCREYEECLQLTAALQDRFQGETTHMDYFRSFCFAGLGRMEEAIAAVDSAVADNGGVGRGGMANVYWLAGRTDEAWDLVGGRDGNDPTRFSMRAVLYSLEGDHDQAIDLLEQALEANPAMTFFYLTSAIIEEPLRDVPRFQELMRSINVPGY
jgi:serine/threonine-protein kinase